VSAAGAYLWHGQFLSRDRTWQAMAELFAVPVSAGAVAGMVSRIAGALDLALEAIRAAALVRHFRGVLTKGMGLPQGAPFHLHQGHGNGELRHSGRASSVRQKFCRMANPSRPRIDRGIGMVASECRGLVIGQEEWLFENG
jgi:hypothetical protein